MAHFDISPGISTGSCSRFRHLTYITLNTAAHQLRQIHVCVTVQRSAHAGTVPCLLCVFCVSMSSVVIAPDISRIEFGVNVDVLYKPIIQSLLSLTTWVKGQADVILSDKMTKHQQEWETKRTREGISHRFGGCHRDAKRAEHSQRATPKLPANNKVLSETFMTFINKSG